MEYIKEIKRIVEHYAYLNEKLNELIIETNRLQQKKDRLEKSIESTKLEEAALIDKITKETGSVPDYYKIMQEINGNENQLV